MKLRSHLALLVLAALVPALVFSGVLLGIVHRHTRAAVERGLMDTARALSLTVDHELQATIRTLRALGATPSLARDDLRRFHEAARAVLATQECWDNIVLFDPSARELVNLRRPFG